MQIEMKSTVDITVDLLAQIFCSLDDDQMCKFFVKVHEEASKVSSFDNQWYYLGGHLRNCECSNEVTRDMLRNIVQHMETSDHS
jgi:hypothetical protein